MAYVVNYKHRGRRGGLGDAEQDRIKGCIEAGGSFGSCIGSGGGNQSLTAYQGCIAGGGSPTSCASVASAGGSASAGSGASGPGLLSLLLGGGGPPPGAYPGYPPGMYPPGYGAPGMSSTAKVALVGGAALALILILKR